MKISPFELGIIHFVGIGGIGMSALADIMHGLGYQVQGSDIGKNANTDRLEKKGIKIFVNQSQDNIKNVQTLVVSSAIKEDNPEYIAALKKEVAVIHRSDLLVQIARLKWSIAVTGSHGKTSITSLAAHLLETAHTHPTVINGGIINRYDSNSNLGNGSWIVLEADESDGSFLKLSPTISIVANLDEEHMDHYDSFDHLKTCFLSFLNNMPFYGYSILGYDDIDVRNLIPKLKSTNFVTYGLHPDADIYAKNISYTPNGMCFDVEIKEKSSQNLLEFKNLALSMLGKHNIQNALAVLALGIKLNLKKDVIYKAFSTFTGVKRRLSLLLNKPTKALVYDDYAHHPQEVKATLEALSLLKEENPKMRIIAVFQPHRYSRLSNLFGDFARAFKLADITYILPVFSAGEKKNNQFNHKTLSQAAKQENSSSACIAVNENEELFQLLKKDLHPQDVVIFMGAGSITNIAASFVKSYQ